MVKFIPILVELVETEVVRYCFDVISVNVRNWILKKKYQKNILFFKKLLLINFLIT
jgi:hypothetical protein